MRNDQVKFFDLTQEGREDEALKAQRELTQAMTGLTSALLLVAAQNTQVQPH